MECKCINFCNNLIDVDELIDTLWNVNPARNLSRVFAKKELIDTLWNVNALAQHFEESENSELIDTLWNVNF